jgi:hypothetical protein
VTHEAIQTQDPLGLASPQVIGINLMPMEGKVFMDLDWDTSGLMQQIKGAKGILYITDEYEDIDEPGASWTWRIKELVPGDKYFEYSVGGKVKKKWIFSEPKKHMKTVFCLESFLDASGEAHQFDPPVKLEGQSLSPSGAKLSSTKRATQETGSAKTVKITKRILWGVVIFFVLLWVMN